MVTAMVMLTVMKNMIAMATGVRIGMKIVAKIDVIMAITTGTCMTGIVRITTIFRRG
jgi:hypothetical protein